MKEIGGYFGLEELIKNEYYKDLISLNTARNALLYLIKAKKINKLYIPYYLCDSVSGMLKKHRYDFEYYRIDNEFHPIFNKALNSDEYLYIVNYYGQLSNDVVIFLKNKYNRIILDNTHAFFQGPLKGIDTIYSCRKFFGVPDGAYLFTDIELKEELKIDISKERMAHLLGRFEGRASDYYKDFREIDKSFKELPLKKMSELTHNILGAIDYSRAQKARERNYKYLAEKLQHKNLLKIVEPIGPFMYPMYVRNGIEVREKMAEKFIYIPILWPNVISDMPKNSIEYEYAENILPLPCDQRYNIKEINTLLEEVIKYV